MINLSKDQEKKNRMQEIADQLQLNFTYIDAVYGKELSQDKVDKVSRHEQSEELFKRRLFRGEIGVALSQMSIYQKMIDENIEQAIIFEDDVIIDKSIHEVIDSIDNFPKDWELVMLGYHRHFIKNRFHRISFRNRKRISKHFKIVRFTDLMHGAFGYMISLNGAKKLISTLSEGIIEPIDHYTGNEKKINLYGVYPRCVKVDADLQSTIMQERIEHDISSKSTTKALNNKDKLKKVLGKIGLLFFIKKINYHRSVFQEELFWLPKRLKTLKKYR